MQMDWGEKSRITESSAKSKAGGFLLEMGGEVLSELLPDSFSLFTTLILCMLLLMAVMVWAARFLVRD